MLDDFPLPLIPPEDEALRPQVRAFLHDMLGESPLAQRVRSWSGFDAGFSRCLAERGWVGLTLPQALGGGGRSLFARFVVVEELLAAGAPVAAHWFAERQSGPLLLKFGTPQQQAFHIPRICRAESFFCIGMSEPGAGSDLAGVRTRAVRSAGGWLLNGQKIWSTHAPQSHYMIALVRTSGSADDRQQGLSQLIVDLSLPGITLRPIRDLAGDAHFSEVFFDNVELPADALVGVEGEGWQQVTAELAYERSGLERVYSSIVLMQPWLAWLRAQPDPGPALLVQAGQVATRLAVLRQMAAAVTARLVQGHSPVVEAALFKDLGTRFEQDLPIALADSLHADPGHPPPQALRRALDYVAQVAPSYSLRGGTREVLRGMIARGLGLR